MSWFNRPEGFQSKSFDAAAPTIAASNGIRASMSPLERAEEDLAIHNGECFEPTCDEHMRLEEEVDLQSFEF